MNQSQNKLKMNKIAKITLVSASLMIGIGTAAYFTVFMRPQENLSDAKADYTLNTKQIVDEFTFSEDSANKKFLNKIIEISGPLASVEKNKDSSVNIILRNEGEISGVSCSLLQEVIKDTSLIKIGQTVTLKGKCSGMLMDVILNNCVIIK